MKNRIIFILPRNRYRTFGNKDIMYDTNNIIFENGKGQLKIKEQFIKEYLEGVFICELEIYGDKRDCKIGCLF